ncbi:unnamed protein product [Sphagnum troendelagicum]
MLNKFSQMGNHRLSVVGQMGNFIRLRCRERNSKLSQQRTAVSTPVPGDGNSRGPAARVDDLPHVSTVDETSEVARVNGETKGGKRLTSRIWFRVK